MQVIHVLTAFSIPDLLASGPLTAAEIATAAGVPAVDKQVSNAICHPSACSHQPHQPHQSGLSATVIVTLLMRTCRRAVRGFAVAGTATGSVAGLPGGRDGPSRRHSLPQQSPVRHSSQRPPQQRQVQRHEMRMPLPTTRGRDADFPDGLTGRDLRAVLAVQVQLPASKARMPGLLAAMMPWYGSAAGTSCCSRGRRSCRRGAASCRHCSQGGCHGRRRIPITLGTSGTT